MHYFRWGKEKILVGRSMNETKKKPQEIKIRTFRRSKSNALDRGRKEGSWESRMITIAKSSPGSGNSWNGFRKWHFRASKFQKFLGKHAPRPSLRLAPAALVSLAPPPPPPLHTNLILRVTFACDSRFGQNHSHELMRNNEVCSRSFKL